MLLPLMMERRLRLSAGRYFRSSIMQRAEPLSLLNYKLEVGTRDTYTKQGVPVTVNGVSIIKVGSTIEEVSTAAEQYLGKETEELKVEAKEVLEVTYVQSYLL